MGKSGVVGKDEEKKSLKKSCNRCSDESSSSIGRNSDEKSSDGEEVQSSFNGTFIQALEEVLPIRRGISRFYNGKSNSFVCLGDAPLSPVAKPENAYNRRRRNALACTLLTGEKNRRVTATSRRAMALNKHMATEVVNKKCK